MVPLDTAHAAEFYSERTVRGPRRIGTPFCFLKEILIVFTYFIVIFFEFLNFLSIIISPACFSFAISLLFLAPELALHRSAFHLCVLEVLRY